MATKVIRKNAAKAGDLSGFQTSRYEKNSVAWGTVANSDASVGDVFNFAELPSKKIVYAKFVSTSGKVLEILPSTDTSASINFPADGDGFDYVIWFEIGTGRVGSNLSITLTASA